MISESPQSYDSHMQEGLFGTPNVHSTSLIVPAYEVLLEFRSVMLIRRIVDLGMTVVELLLLAQLYAPTTSIAASCKALRKIRFSFHEAGSCQEPRGSFQNT